MITLKQAMTRIERELLLERLTLGSKLTYAEIAASLGITRKCLWEKMKKHGITEDEIANESAGQVPDPDAGAEE